MSITSYPELVSISSSGNTVDFAATKTDAFNRLRVSSPLTLFDSTHRFADNDLWVEDTTGTASSTFVAAEGLIDMDVGTASGDEIIRETTKVFAYQPGKSLLVMNTFVMDAAKTGLRQRVGYYGSDNGIYVELDDSTTYFVKRSAVTGSVVNTRVAQSSWNIDVMDGTGPSGVTLDITKAQLMWMDLEWLGVGTVRIGFVVDSLFIHCHSFYHSNIITSTYITTASLPLRYEITNTGDTAGASQLKQISSSVISEGGYELSGLQQAISTPIATPYDLTSANTYYPIISIRLKTSPDRLDAIVIQTSLSIMGLTNNANYNWRVVASGTTTGGTWVSAGANSSVNYNITGTSFTGGRILASGWFQGSNQGSSTIDILKEALFKFQLERDTFTSTPFELTLVTAGNSAGADVYASMDWEEVSR